MSTGLRKSFLLTVLAFLGTYLCLKLIKVLLRSLRQAHTISDSITTFHLSRVVSILVVVNFSECLLRSSVETGCVETTAILKLSVTWQHKPCAKTALFLVNI